MNDTDGTPLAHRGLSAGEVLASRAAHGANLLTPPVRDPWWRLFLEKFDDPVIRILIIAAGLAILTGLAKGELAEGVGIILAILLATTLAFLNEHRAAKEFDILNQVNDDIPSKAVRDGAFVAVPRRDLVVGDVLFVEVGEEFPADGDVVEAVSFSVNESRLTGEPMPVAKLPLGGAPPEHEGAYPPHRAFRGTTVVDGYGFVKLTEVGDRTEIGRTARAASEDNAVETPLNRQLAKLSKVIGVVGLGFAAVTFFALLALGAAKADGPLKLTAQQWTFVALLMASCALALVRVWLPMLYDAAELAGVEVEPPAWLENDTLGGWVATAALGGALFCVGLVVGHFAGLTPSRADDWLPAGAFPALLKYFMIAVTIIVVAVPEGLAMSVTLSLAYSMRKMAAGNNLVRRMHACETIGAATVICSDKTGTLTMNAMRVREADFPALEGQPLRSAIYSAAGRRVCQAVAVNTTAQLSRESGRAAALGNPTEGALLLWLDEQAIDYATERRAAPVVGQLTFSTERKFMATVVLPIGESSTMHVKGAPEVVLARCDKQLTPAGERPLSGVDAEAVQTRLAEFQARGMRTLGFAYLDRPTAPTGDLERAAESLTWLGFVAIEDPIRAEVPTAVADCGKAGVAVKVVTGDNQETALEIGRQIGLWSDVDKTGEQQLNGMEFSRLSDALAAEAAGKLKVLSRARPLDKLRLVRLLQGRGEVVAVTGDGTNDAPALNQADVGLAMGKTGTAVAKEASDIVLLDDSFGSIVNAVYWGRSLYENIQRFILFQLTINVAALGIALLGPFLGVELPLTVTQMLWVNLIMDTFAALALATEPPHPHVLAAKPRGRGDFIVTPAMAYEIFGVGAVFLAVLLLMLKTLPGLEESTPNRSHSIFFTVFVMLQFWNMFNAKCLNLTQSAFTGLHKNPSFLLIASAIVVGQVLIVQYGGKVFRLAPLSVADWLVITAATSVVLVAGEMRRFLARRG